MTSADLDATEAFCWRVVRRGRHSDEFQDDLQQSLDARLEGVIHMMIESVDRPAVARALRAPDQVSAMGVLLAEFINERPEVVLSDLEAAMQTRLFNARRNLLERAGGTLTTAEAAEVLGTTAGAVRKRIQRGTLLSYCMASAGSGLLAP